MKKKSLFTILIVLSLLTSMTCVVSAKSNAPARVKIKSCRMSTFNCNTVTIKWSKVKNAKGYQIYHSVKKNKGYKKVDDLKSSESSCDIYTPDVGKTHYYKVRAYSKKNGKIYYGKWSKVRALKVKENGPPLEMVYADFNFKKGFGYGYFPHYSSDSDMTSVILGNFSKKKKVYIHTEDVMIFNHNNSYVDAYIEAYTSAYGTTFKQTQENEVITLAPRKTIVLVVRPYADQQLIKFKNIKKNVNMIGFDVGYSAKAAKKYTYLWMKIGGHGISTVYKN